MNNIMEMKEITMMTNKPIKLHPNHGLRTDLTHRKWLILRIQSSPNYNTLRLLKVIEKMNKNM